MTVSKMNAELAGVSSSLWSSMQRHVACDSPVLRPDTLATLGCSVTVSVLLVALVDAFRALAVRVELLALHAMRGAACLGVRPLAGLSAGAAVRGHACAAPARARAASES